MCVCVSRLMSERDVVLYCDFHGHSRKNNVFMYGCDNRHDASRRLQERVFPLMMSKNANDKVALWQTSLFWSFSVPCPPLSGVSRTLSPVPHTVSQDAVDSMRDNAVCSSVFVQEL